MTTERARTLIFTGNGKGKTTAMIGVIVRSLGCGKNVLLVRFAKARHSWELDILSTFPGIDIVSGNYGMTPPASHPDFEKHAEAARDLFRQARERADKYDLICLDEICGIVARNMVTEDEVVDFVKSLRPDQAVVMTGRGAGVKLIAVADTVSEVNVVKHGYMRGIEAQEGIEF
ncbi:MAG: cob(I)yrinic acid a,c-diamide adenosyltransferase [Planctomycetes bacterium]|nr:cob(I)yrinic acid a,c-diamide adenosyltransferase [Planctomycetota bacterium]